MPFSNTGWDGNAVRAALGAEDYCACCLIDENEPRTEKVKERCKLPVRRGPGAPYNIVAMRAAAAALLGARGGVDAPAEAKQKAARKLVRLFREAKLDPPEGLVRMVE